MPNSSSRSETNTIDLLQGEYICWRFAQTTFHDTPRILILVPTEEDGEPRTDVETPVFGTFWTEEVKLFGGLQSVPLLCCLGMELTTPQKKKDRLCPLAVGQPVGQAQEAPPAQRTLWDRNVAALQILERKRHADGNRGFGVALAGRHGLARKTGYFPRRARGCGRRDFPKYRRNKQRLCGKNRKGGVCSRAGNGALGNLWNSLFDWCFGNGECADKRAQALLSRLSPLQNNSKEPPLQSDTKMDLLPLRCGFFTIAKHLLFQWVLCKAGACSRKSLPVGNTASTLRAFAFLLLTTALQQDLSRFSLDFLELLQKKKTKKKLVNPNPGASTPALFVAAGCQGLHLVVVLLLLPSYFQLCGLIAQLIEQCTGIADVMGSNPIEVT